MINKYLYVEGKVNRVPVQRYRKLDPMEWPCGHNANEEENILAFDLLKEGMDEKNITNLSLTNVEILSDNTLPRVLTDIEMFATTEPETHFIPEPFVNVRFEEFERIWEDIEDAFDVYIKEQEPERKKRVALWLEKVAPKTKE